MATPRNRITVAPTKQHFFQPLLPGFEHEFSIPAKFFKFLKGQECEKAILRTPISKNWPVKIVGRRFEDGWKEFAQNHDLHVGDFLVFKHQGDMIFDVLVFDPSACEREFHSFDTEKFHVKEEKIEIQEEEEEEEEQLPRKSSPGSSKNKKKKKKKIRGTLVAKAPTFSVPGHSYFVATLTTSGSREGRLSFPMGFARLHSLTKRCKIILLDQEGRSWPVNLWHRKSDGQVYIGRGWTSCRVANGLKAGDSFMIHVIEKGKRPILKLGRLQANLEAKKKPIHHDAQIESNLENSQPKISEEELAKELSSAKLKKMQPSINLKAKASSVLQHPYFVTKVTFSSVVRARMYIPKIFAKQNNLMNRHCKMILMDPEGRSWPAKLWYREASKQEAYIHGWNASHVSNLKPGDPVLFELIDKGRRPVFKMHRLQANLEAKVEPIYHDEQVGPSSIAPHFGVITKASELENSLQNVPEELAKESSSCKPHQKSQTMTTTEVKASSSVQECSYFVVKVTSSGVIYDRMYIPMNVKTLDNFSNGYSEIILMDQEERSWPAKLCYKKSNGQAYICDWNAFRVANDLEPGDSFIFELIEGRKMHILKMHCLKAKLKANKEQSHQDVETGSSSMKHPYFCVTTKKSHIKNSVLKIPRNFARRNNITSKISEMIVQNERGRSWLLSVGTDKMGGVYLSGWTKFAKENGLRKGDAFMLELAEGVKEPTFKFYGMNQETTCNKIYKDNAQTSTSDNC